ncbi:MAG: efflux RND transporter periplasmic adaptor subunit [Congregibacter sp.]
MRAYVVAVVLLIALLGSTAFYIQQRFAAMSAGDFERPPETIAASTAKAQSWRETVASVGTVRAARGILLTAEISGNVKAVQAASGDQVSAGQALVSIDEEFEAATRERLEARLILAQQLYDRDARLIRDNSIPQSQLDQTASDLRSARAELAEVDARLNTKRITAPFSGRLGILQVRLGDYVEAGTPIATLQDLSTLDVDFSVPDRYAPFMRPGLNMSLRTAAYPDRSYQAVLEAVDAQVDENTRNLLLRARIQDGEGLLPGMFASLEIDLDRESTRIFVPETAVTYSLQGDLVYVVEEDDQGLLVSPRIVRTIDGAPRGQIALSSGIAAGERVVIAGQNKLYRGARVQIDETVELN